MSQFEEVFMAGFWDAMGAEKTASEEVEMPVLGKALGNLGLLEEEETEEVDMPVLKQAMENLGLLEKDASEAEEEGDEPVSTLQALAMTYGGEVAQMREQEALEKDAGAKMQMIREKAKAILKRVPGAKDISAGMKERSKARSMKGSVNEPHAKAQLAKKVSAYRKKLAKGGGKAAGTLAGAATVGEVGRRGIKALMGKKKDKKKKK